MYRHTVDDIRETSEKVFVSSEEKKKFSMYGDRFSTIEDTYNKEELDTHISKLQVKDVIVEGEVISEKDTVSGIISDIELFGNTKQRVETITIVPELMSGTIDNNNGNDVDNPNDYKTDFLSVKYLDEVSYKNGDKIRFAHLHVYNDKKEYLGYYGIQESEFTITDRSAAYIRLHHYTNDSDNITLTIKRTHLDDIQSVGELLPDGKYSIHFNSVGCNIFDDSSDKVIGYINDSGDVINHNESWCVHDFLELPKVKKISVSESGSNYRQYRVVFYDCNKDIISVEDYESHNTNPYTVNVPENVRYYRLSYSIKVNNIPVTRENIQVVIGDEQCDYEEYNKVSSNIVLPVQLEKIGDVSDRLFRREDGVWCIEKKMRKEVISSKTHSYLIRTGFNVASIIMFFLPDGMGKSIGESSLTLKYKTMASLPFYSASSEPDGTNPWDSTSSFLHHFFTLRLNDNGTVEIWDRNLSIYFDKNWTEQQILDWVDSQNITVVYPLHEPEIIELPLDVQISLNSFNNVTHIFTTSGDLEGKLKVTLPKSLGSSIESLMDKSNKVSNSIENIKKLKNGQVIDYRSNKGFINIENNSGIVSDVSLEGQTLVNILPDTWRDRYTYGNENHEVGTQKDYFRRTPTNVKVKPNTEYTVIATVVRNSLKDGQYFTIVDSHNDAYIGSTFINIPNNFKGLFVAKFISHAEINDSTLHKSYLRTKENCTNPGIIEISEMMIIEGDHTDKPLSYFSGLKSVGDAVDKFEIKSSSKNIIDLLDYKSKTTAGASIDVYESNKLKITTSPDNTNRYASVWFDNVNFIPGVKYRVKIKVSKSVSHVQPIFSIRQSIKADVSLKDIGEYNGVIDGTFIPTNRTHRLEFFGGNQVGQLADTWAIFEDIQIFIEDEDTNMESFILPENNKKQLMYYDNISNQWLKPILRSLPNGIKDTIEKHSDGKYYYHKRCGEIILNGSETIAISGVGDQIDTIAFNISFTGSCNSVLKDNITTLSDKFKSIPFANEREDKEHVLQGFKDTQQYIRLRILRTKLSTQDINGFKSWLQTNNVTIVYQLANEEVYECNDLTLNLYDKSSVICESGPILPILQVSVASFIGNVLNNIKDRVSKLESALYDNYLFRNKMMLQNMYSSDDTLFKVALEVMNTRDISNNEDSELLELILKNIEPGKENYDRYFMESVIDFYTIIGKISFDVADELFELIEKQHEAVIDVIVD